MMGLSEISHWVPFLAWHFVVQSKMVYSHRRIPPKQKILWTLSDWVGHRWRQLFLERQSLVICMSSLHLEWRPKRFFCNWNKHDFSVRMANKCQTKTSRSHSCAIILKYVSHGINRISFCEHVSDSVSDRSYCDKFLCVWHWKQSRTVVRKGKICIF